MSNFEFPRFEPHRLIRGGNTQTIVGAYLSPPVEPEGTGLFFAPTTLGDEIALHSNQPNHRNQQATPARRQVLMLHGLAGCHGSTYMIRTCKRMLERGVGVWRMDSRGSGAGTARAKYHHHAARSEDVQAAVSFILKKLPDCQLTVIGFSLGGNVVLHWLSSKAIPSNVAQAIAVAPPINLYRCSENLKSGLSRIYDAHFAKELMRRVRQRKLVRPDMIDFPFKRRPKTLAEFDAQFTAPAGGFKDLHDYYRSSSTHQRLENIQTRTLLIVDEHDPVVPIDLFDQARLSDSIEVWRTSGGGHLGYVSRLGADPDRFWLPWRIAEAVNR